ncbi:histidine kinase [Phaffia rhodozyma]|uniref:Histidine kinase n=1 Tax=Phaffia rhodozyma TaxID=264483 RepID=A0A0F7SWD7_PHARH|nr:histidine kinase [Phaffia rhodozyma]
MVLSVPRYKFASPVPWIDVGSSTMISLGTSLEDGSNVFAKVASYSTSGTLIIEREMHILGKLSENYEASGRVLRVIDFFVIPPDQGNVCVLILKHPGVNTLPNYFPSFETDSFLCPSTRTDGAVGSVEEEDVPMSREEMSMIPTTKDQPTMSGLRNHIETDLDDGATVAAAADDDNDNGGDLTPMAELERIITDQDVDRDGEGRKVDIDIASFLEFAVQATQCVELLHSNNIIHREIRPNAFHLNLSAGTIRWAHFGNRSISLEGMGGPNGLVLASEAMGDKERKQIVRALNYLAPEQTGRVQFQSDHRTDLYCLGMTFYSILTGSVAFEGRSFEVFKSIVADDPPKVHEIRPDVPRVISAIIFKLLSKNPDDRYLSVVGLKADLLTCQHRLTEGWNSKNETAELVPFFEIASQDKFSEFVLPNKLFGRSKELEIMRVVIKRVASTHTNHYATHNFLYPSSSTGGSVTHSNPTTTTNYLVGGGAQTVDSGSDMDSATFSIGGSASGDVVGVSVGVGGTSVGVGNGVVGKLKLDSSLYPNETTGTGTLKDSPGSQERSESIATHSGQGSSNLGHAHVLAHGLVGGNVRSHGNAKERLAAARAIVITGPAGVGKSALVLASQTVCRSSGFYGVAKFDATETSPYSAILSSLSLIFKQLLTEFQSDLHAFVNALQLRLGPQLSNIQLLFHAVPELKELLSLFGFEVHSPAEPLPSSESRSRFQSLCLNVIATLAQMHLLTMFFDDLHYADEPSLSLIRSIASAKIRMLIITTLRPDDETFVARVRQIFGNGSRATYINLSPLSASSVMSLVKGTLHESNENVLTPLVNMLYRHTKGNAFSIRNLLVALKRHNHIYFDWTNNIWRFNIQTIESTFFSQIVQSDDDNDISFLLQHLNDLPHDVQRFLVWGSFFGGQFRPQDIITLMDQEETSGSDDSEDELRLGRLARGSINGLQVALAEGWLISRGREWVTFAHDRYRQAALNLGLEQVPRDVQMMALKIADLLLASANPDYFQIAEHLLKCVPLLVVENHGRNHYRKILQAAGDIAIAQGAHETALRYIQACKELLEPDSWSTEYQNTIDLYLSLIELLTWKGDSTMTGVLVKELHEKCICPVDRARVFRAESRSFWMRGALQEALNLFVEALGILGIHVAKQYSQQEINEMYELTKSMVMATGMENILSSPKATDPRIELASSILSEASTTAYWARNGLSDVIGLMIVQLSLKHGMTASSSLGFAWFGGTASEVHDAFRFAGGISRLALQLADTWSNNTEKGRVTLLYGILAAPFDGESLRANHERFLKSTKYSLAAGDRTYSCLGVIHQLAAKLYSSEHVSDGLLFCEEAIADVIEWAGETEMVTLIRGVAGTMRAIAGKTINTSPETILDSEDFCYATDYPANAAEVVNQWTASFKTLALYSLGWHAAAAETGFLCWKDRDWNPNHYHVRAGLHYHSLAMIECLRTSLPPATEKRYRDQIAENQRFIGRWLDTGSVNFLHWLTLVEAELASLDNGSDAFRLYDEAVKLAQDGGWVLDEGNALFLSGSHFVRSGVKQFGTELQNRAIARHTHWGSFGISNYLSSKIVMTDTIISRACADTSEIGVQTDYTAVGPVSVPQRPVYNAFPSAESDEEHPNFENLTTDDLTAIIKASQVISSDVNVSATLESLTELTVEYSGADTASIVVKLEDGQFSIATKLVLPGNCVYFERPILISENPDPLFQAVMGRVLQSKETVFLSNAATDPRFMSATQAAPGQHPKSVVCLAIEHKSLVLGAIYLTSGKTNAFTPSNVNVLQILARQASIAIGNALLFRKLHRATQANIRMIDQQKKSLEEARKSRQEAMTATKIKSNFLASMSHELRTPFSSFYGLLGLLSETTLNSEQREFVGTARQSCELLLEIIDSLLDYSKLEAGAVKLELLTFSPEGLIAECQELLLTLATQRSLELTYNIDPKVPSHIISDPSRIRQIIMNMLGNALKFTHTGSVNLECTLDESSTVPHRKDEIVLRFEVTDTGIGMSKAEQLLLFQPFSQVDGSTTRVYGGTGLGLSICLQLVKLMGGTIGVESEVNKGSVFSFSIPAKIVSDSPEARKALDDRAALSSALCDHGRPAILISSSSSATTALISSALTGSFIVTTASMPDTQAALISQSFSLIILDHQAEDSLAQVRKMVQKLPIAPKIVYLLVPTAANINSKPKDDAYPFLKPIRRAKLLKFVVDLLHDNVANTAPVKKAVIPHKTLDQFTVEEIDIFKSKNILIAEDNPVASKLLCKTLERLGLVVVAAVNGNDAVTEWERRPDGYFSLGLFDHHMPFRDGPSATARIRLLESKSRRSHRLPIVGLSADCQQSAKLLCISSGMQNYLSKPLRQAELVTLLRDYILR